MLFDTHAHILSDDLARYPYSPLRGGGTLPVQPLVFTAEDLVAAMDAGGVAHACLVQRATLYGYDNRYCLDVAARYPARFAVVVVLDGQDPGSPAMLRSIAAHQPIGGLRIVAPALSEHDTDWLDSDQSIALWQAAATLGLPVTVILYRRNHGAALPALLRIARRFRDLTILIDHVGVPHASLPEGRWAQANGIDYPVPGPPGFGIEENLKPFAELPNVYFKLTDINFDRLAEEGLDSAAFTRELADRVGAERLLWGSDVGQSPAPYAEKIERLEAATALLTDTERAMLRGTTAQRLYRHALACVPIPGSGACFALQ